jgi:hypothetical protein
MPPNTSRRMIFRKPATRLSGGGAGLADLAPRRLTQLGASPEAFLKA